ncbi:MAG: hypothetical protein K2Z81_26385 [Cyanobacteria bacterium]|nr:hypothetical protein [Cyanobacteriota bacterium]
MNPVEVQDTTQTDNTASTATTGGEDTVQNDRFDEFRLNLNRDAFAKIDTDSSESLSLDELKAASGSEDYTEKEKEAIGGLQQRLEGSPSIVGNLGDHEIKFHAVIPSWFDREFAQTQITKQDFEVIDSDHDKFLSRDELVQANKSDKLSPLTKHAASILKDHLDMTEDDPLVAAKDVKIRDWLRDPEHYDAQGKAEHFADRATRGVTERTGKQAAWPALMRGYSDLQGLWAAAEKLPGDPRETVERMLNKELRGTGNVVRVHSSDEQGRPDQYWMKTVKAFMTVNPREGSVQKQMMGNGIIGLGHRSAAESTEDKSKK